jgi:hypothetical protein
MVTLYLPPSREYRVPAVESTASAGRTWCRVCTMVGIGLSMLSKPPATTVPAKHRTVTAMATICSRPSGAACCVWYTITASQTPTASPASLLIVKTSVP